MLQAGVRMDTQPSAILYVCQADLALKRTQKMNDDLRDVPQTNARPIHMLAFCLL